MTDSTTDVWKYFENYKIYSENKKVIADLLQITDSKIGASYFSNEGLVGQDVIIPANRIEFAKMLLRTQKKSKTKSIKNNNLQS